MFYFGDSGHPYPMVYICGAGDQKYLVALNPSGKHVQAKIPTQHARRATYALGANQSVKFESGGAEDTITLPSTSVAIFRLER